MFLILFILYFNKFFVNFSSLNSKIPPKRVRSRGEIHVLSIQAVTNNYEQNKYRNEIYHLTTSSYMICESCQNSLKYYNKKGWKNPA